MFRCSSGTWTLHGIGSGVLPLAAAAHGRITQAVYDSLNTALQAELKEYTRIRHVVMVEKDLDP